MKVERRMLFLFIPLYLVSRRYVLLQANGDGNYSNLCSSIFQPKHLPCKLRQGQNMFNNVKILNLTCLYQGLKAARKRTFKRPTTTVTATQQQAKER